MLVADEHIGVEAVAANLHTLEEFREMFLGAIDIQKAKIVDAEHTIKRYEQALSDLALQEI